MGVHVYWGPRELAVGEATELLRSVMRRVVALGPPFDSLYVERQRGRDPVVPWTDDAALAEALVLKGRFWTEVRPREQMTALGYRIALNRNLRKPWQAGVDVSIGVTSPYVPNHIGLEFDPNEDHGSERQKACIAALEALIDVADPDSGVITSTGFRGLTTPPYLPLGWITYLSDRLLGRRAIPKLPTPAVVTRLGSGWLLQLTREWFEHERTEHRGTATAAIAAMRRQLPDLDFVVRTRPSDVPTRLSTRRI